MAQHANDTLLICDDSDIKNALELLQNAVRNVSVNNKTFFKTQHKEN